MDNNFNKENELNQNNNTVDSNDINTINGQNNESSYTNNTDNTAPINFTMTSSDSETSNDTSDFTSVLPETSPASTENQFNEPIKKKRTGFTGGKFALGVISVITISVLSGVLGGVITHKYIGTKPITQTATAPINYSNYAPMNEAVTGGMPVPQIVETVKAGVVAVSSKTVNQLGQQGESVGSGFIFSKDGYIMTNYHVIEGASEVTILFNDNSQAKGKVVNYDANLDLAVIKVTDNKEMPAVLELGDSSKLVTGQPVVAIGNPLGTEFLGTVTTGIISSTNRDVNGNSFLQTDAAINAGNSGGPLLNDQGQVIGINTLKMSGSSESSSTASVEGMGFSIPINVAKEKIDALIKPALVLGISCKNITSDVAEYYSIPEGVAIMSITEFSAAEKAGLLLNDIITEMDGKPVKTVADINTIKNSHVSGDTIKFKVYRDKKYLDINVTLS
ncbi:S1C family serine protease [Clostridium cellulovorans]|uniref:Peptidase S1 and S6 chymotrypsin/Hap n=1 Tax=Clostridium cellulovorans (strain ATCC 35296 / DSM 3052 / OCM 3 / 743B) TaxID=573061 RepID=D9SNM9_CLOC7|nr:trypsin-like peptidase domain-containing protein [Clostridium cellulovorans]ADL49900.1 peptidase S1 and S6 chymotrypsin/Hap [Clostridium cellulovorans 743B]